MDFNIALLPDEPTCLALVNLSRTIASRITTQITLNGNDVVPHLTIYLAHFPAHNVHEVRNVLKDVCEKFPPIPVQLKGWTMSTSGSVMLNCESPRELRSLHEEITLLTNKLREGGIADAWKMGEGKFTRKEARLLEKIGFPYGLELWNPHFTVAKINPRNGAEIKEILNHFQAAFIGRKIALGSSDREGVVTQILQEFTLSGSCEPA
jgi:2'-5' RNA ligase